MIKNHYVHFASTHEFIDAYVENEEKLGPKSKEAKVASRGLYVKSKSTGEFYPVVVCGDKNLLINNGQGKIDLIKLFDDYTFVDGSPLGKEVKDKSTSHEKKLHDELSIGTRFHYKGKLVEVVEGDQCVDCVFALMKECSLKRCVPERRSDKKDVYFKEVKGERLQAED